MKENFAGADALLAAALRGEVADWPEDIPIAVALERIRYHGVAGLIAERAGELSDWPNELLEPVRQQAIAQAKWELRHKAVLVQLLAALAGKKIVTLILKGTALAYDLYRSPAARARGDTDILVAAVNLDRTRSVLTRLGYVCQRLDKAADDLALQEVWCITDEGGSRHNIDVHWQLLNAPALRRVLEFADCTGLPMPLPRLCAHALSLNRVLALVHACVHRAMHITSPYFVDGVTHYGGDRLIWIHDIHLLASAFSTSEWRAFVAHASQQGVAAVCFDGLVAAKRFLATETPYWVRAQLGAVGREPASAYLLKSHQFERAWKDLLAVGGWHRKLGYLASRVLPSSVFVRGKYPGMARTPLGLLYARRMVDLILARPRRGES